MLSGLRPSTRASVVGATVMIALTALPIASCRPATPESEIVVFAAASLRDAIEELALRFEQETGIRVVLNLAGSNTLALQIFATGGADVFVSADESWMDEIERAGLVEPGTRTSLLTNSLVIVARRDSHAAIGEPADLATASYRALALADPEVVPAGRYAREALGRISLGSRSLWASVAERVVPTADVRAALALVESDPAILGIVYATDARASSRVVVLSAFAPGEAPAIRYVGAVIRGRPSAAAAREFLVYLRNVAGREAFVRHGFTIPEGRDE